MKDFYAEEVTTESYKELVNFSEWMNRHHGHYPTIVGGWAVHAYVGGLGSRDVDIVFPTAESRDAVMTAYFNTHGYVQTGNILQRSYVKVVKTREGEEEIILDICTAQDSVVVGDDIRIPWSWATKYSVKHPIGGAHIYIPEIELLLVYKIAAIVGRRRKLKVARETGYLTAKVWKDCRDVLSLLQKEIDLAKFNKFASDSGLASVMGEFFEGLAVQKELLDEFKTDERAIRKILNLT